MCEIALTVNRRCPNLGYLLDSSQSHITTDDQPVRVGVKPHLGFMTVFNYCWTATVQSMWGALFKEMMGLSFVAVIIGNMSQLYAFYIVRQLSICTYYSHFYMYSTWYNTLCMYTQYCNRFDQRVARQHLCKHGLTHNSR
jgi:hypothetical protein